MNKRLFPLVQAAMIAAALIGGNAASIVSAEDAPVIPQETALTDSAEPDTPEPEFAPDEPAETPEEPEAPAEPEIVEFAAEPEEAALEALMSAPESEPIEPEIVQAAAETLSAMPTARKAAALKAMRPVTYVPEGLPEGVTLSVDVPPAAFSEPVEIYARFLTDPEDGSFSEDIIAAAQTQYEEALAACEEGYSAGVMLFDLSFVNEAGEEVEPALPVSVNLTYSPNEDMSETEVSNIRHYIDAEDVTVYEDLDYSAIAAEEATEICYITESCSYFTITYVYNFGFTTKTITIYYYDDNGNEINVPNSELISVDDGYWGFSPNTIWEVQHKDTITANDRKKYVFQGIRLNPNDSNFLENFNYITFVASYFIFGFGQSWVYCKELDNDGEMTEPVYKFAGNNNTSIYYIYSELHSVTLHYGTKMSTSQGNFVENQSQQQTIEYTSSDRPLISDYDIHNPDPDNYELHVYLNSPTGTEVSSTSRMTMTANHYYYVYVPKDPPAPTGVTQKAAPYAAMVILAAVSAAVMIKRRKGGDVDETSPL